MKSSATPTRKNSGRSPRVGLKKGIEKKPGSDGGQTKDSVRTRVVDMLTAALFKDDENFAESREKAGEVATTIETEMFTIYRGTSVAYKDKFRSLNFNIKDAKNGPLRSMVLSGIIIPARLLEMSSLELANPERKEENSQIEKNNLREAQSFNPNKHAATTDMFRCGKCKQRKCTFYQLQTRSADEPLTTFVTCTHCNNRWKC